MRTAADIRRRLIAELSPQQAKLIKDADTLNQRIERIADMASVNQISIEEARHRIQVLIDEEVGRRNIATVGHFIVGASTILARAIKALASPELGEGTRVKTLTYAEAIAFFVEHQPPVRFRCGVMLRNPNRGGGTQFIQAFLTEQDEMVARPDGRPYGRFLMVERLDDELLQLFGAEDLVVVE